MVLGSVYTAVYTCIILVVHVQLGHAQDCPHLGRATPDVCLALITCIHGDCATELQLVGGGFHLVHSCTCLIGWQGPTCDVCSDDVIPVENGDGNKADDVTISSNTITKDMHFNTGAAANNVTINITEVHVTPPLIDFNGPDVRNASDQCMGVPIPDVKASSCNGLTCLHGECQNVSIGQICKCNPGWSEPHCDFCCDLTCHQGTCQVDRSSREMNCFCKNATFTTASNCTEPRAVPYREGPGRIPVWFWGLLALLAVVLCLPILLAYYMWKKRYIFMLKIVYFFQKYDISERLFHVFISYRSSEDDERFVLHKLHRNLEEMNLRVCVHYKDFLPGASIAENIIKAVENSSCTILVLSPDYCTAEWPRFEVQAAMKEMLKLRHRVVPIIYRDITEVRNSGNIDVLLGHILDEFTYLEWPGSEDEKLERRFWQRLKLAMPKVRSRSDPTPVCTESNVVDLATMH